MHIQFQLAQQCIQISTRINSSSVHTYIFVCFTLRVILQGFVTQNATWCQNRGCICISSNQENIWSNPHASSHPDKYNNSVNRIISKEEERRSKERFFNLSSSTVVFPHSYKNYSVSTRNPAIQQVSSHPVPFYIQN